MKYVEILSLINLSIRYGILREQDGKVFIYRNEGKNSHKGWFLESKDFLAQELMQDQRGQDMLIEALAKQGLEFKKMKDFKF